LIPSWTSDLEGCFGNYALGWFAVVVKVVNSVPFRPEWSKRSIPIQKTEQNGTNFISF